MRKVLYSPGFGAGWSSWASGATARFVLEYAPLIEYIEKHGHAPESDSEIMHKFRADLAEFIGEDPYFYEGGLRGLTVGYGDGPVRVEEYDGSESLTWKNTDDDFI